MLPTQTRAEAAPSEAPAPRPRLDYLDGLRGLAALYVVFGHTYMRLPHPVGGVARGIDAALGVFQYGHYAVNIFIVLSGFCLMLPVAGSAEGTLGGGVGGFLRRRVRRILPPYYAALILSLLMLALDPRLTDVDGSGVLPAFTPGVLLSHLFLVHNLSPAWELKIDTPMWSIATEWQIYFLFALLLMPVWRRFGMLGALGTAFVVGMAPHSLFHRYFDDAFPHYLGLFGLGMAGAEIGFSARPAASLLRRSVPWGLLSLFLGCVVLGITVGVHARVIAILGALLCLIVAAVSRARWQSVLVLAVPVLLYLVSLYPPDVIGYGVALDILVGAGTTCLLLAVTNLRSGMSPGPCGPLTWVTTVLEARPFVTLGTYSYSLYLIHRPVILLLHQRMQTLALPPPITLALNLFLVIPLCLPISYLFFLAFERPFLVQRRRETAAEVARDAALSPAP